MRMNAKNRVLMTAAAGAVLLTGALPTMAAAPRPEPPRSAPTNKAAGLEERLNSAGIFATGGIGVAGRVSEETKAFQALLKDPSGKDAFRRLLNAKKVEGRMYALLGLWVVAPEEFDKAYASASKVQETGQTGAGCMLMKQTLAQVAAEIKNGNYKYLREKPKADKG